jgi:hypothetical protein
MKATLLILIAMTSAANAHGAEYTVLQSHSQTFINGSNGYEARSWSTPNGNSFWTDNSGNTVSVFRSGPAELTAPVFPVFPDQ